METRVVAVALAVVLAGCSLPAGLDDSLGGSGTASWEETELVVALSVGTDDAYAGQRRALDATLEYWETNAREYAGHPVEFRLEPNASDPDIRVGIVATVTDCGRERHTAGCAPAVEDLRDYEKPLDVQIRGGFAQSSTRLVMKHEFGHVLGLGHGDDPAAIMQERAVLATKPLPDATERALPWNHSTLSVSVDDRNLTADERATVRDQIDHALAYYDRGADGTVPDNVSFVRTDDRAAADVRILFPANGACGEGAGSCSRLYGSDPDRDGARERYTRLVISVGDVDADAAGWHVARWLATGFGHDESDLPPPLRDASYRERRSDWWD